MKIREEHYINSFDELRSVEITVETKEQTKSFYIGEGEPEDMTFDRDLINVFDISTLIEMAYNAGKNGEDFEKIFEEVRD